MYELLISRGYLGSFPQFRQEPATEKARGPSITFFSMDQIFPSPVDDVDPVNLYRLDKRQSELDRPWVLLNMISSVDGAIETNGVSGGLGGPGDRSVFGAIRGIPDVILVGSGTVIAENYRRPQTPPATQEFRVSSGQAPRPRIAIVSGSLSIPSNHRVFDAEAPPIVVTHEKSPPERRQALAEVADIMVAGDDVIDLELALRNLHRSGAETVLLEGGPTLNGVMFAAGLVDELYLSLAPSIVGGTGSRMLTGSHMGEPAGLALDRVLHQDGYLFLRYLRRT